MINKDESFKKKSILNSNNDAWMSFITQVNKEYILWNRNYKGNSWLKNTIVIHGHTHLPFQSNVLVGGAISGKIWYNCCDINIDCGLVYGRSEKYKEANLAAIRLEDLEEFYVYNQNYPLIKLPTRFFSDFSLSEYWIELFISENISCVSRNFLASCYNSSSY